jgi:peptide/nickel transport system substrate-binding protein
VTWQDTIGTGPFLLTDYVSATSATLTKNPNYYRNDPLHPANKLPYVDKVKVLYVTDEAMRMAALRSGQVDRLSDIQNENAEDLAKTNPELLQHAGNGNLRAIFLRVDLKPFSDLKVRQALMMAIDLQGMQKDYFGGKAALPSVPCFGGDWYTPLDKLPADLKDLYVYNPTKAKQLLTEAGYPNGFETDMIVDMEADIKPQAVIAKNYWDAIGVKTSLVIPPSGATFDQKAYGRDYQTGMFSSGGGADELIGKIWIPGGQQTYYWGVDSKGQPTWREEEVIAKQDEIVRTTDNAKQVALLTDFNLYLARKVYYIGMPCAYIYTIWNPRLHGYNGEATMGIHRSQESMWQYVWVTDGR